MHQTYRYGGYDTVESDISLPAYPASPRPLDDPRQFSASQSSTLVRVPLKYLSRTDCELRCVNHRQRDADDPAKIVNLCTSIQYDPVSGDCQLFQSARDLGWGWPNAQIGTLDRRGFLSEAGGTMGGAFIDTAGVTSSMINAP